MEKVNRIIVTKKEANELKKLKHLFEIMGIDPNAMESRIQSLEDSNKQKDEQIASLKSELASSKEANETFINDKMKNISVNIQKSMTKDGSSKASFSFEGKQIDEKY